LSRTSSSSQGTQQAAEKARPDEQEKKQGVDFQGLKDQGKKTAKGIKSGKVQGEARESIWDEVEGVKEYLDEKLPEGDEARDRLVQEIQNVSWRRHYCLFLFPIPLRCATLR
jgi:hypothetical protein